MDLHRRSFRERGSADLTSATVGLPGHSTHGAGPNCLLVMAAAKLALSVERKG